MKFFPFFRSKKAMTKPADSVDSSTPKSLTKSEHTKQHQIIIETDKIGKELYEITLKNVAESDKMLDLM